MLPGLVRRDDHYKYHSDKTKSRLSEKSYETGAVTGLLSQLLIESARLDRKCLIAQLTKHTAKRNPSVTGKPFCQ